MFGGLLEAGSQSPEQLNEHSEVKEDIAKEMESVVEKIDSSDTLFSGKLSNN